MTKFNKDLTKFSKGLTKFSKGLTKSSKGLTKFSKDLTKFNKRLTKFNKGLTKFSKDLTKFTKGLTKFSKGLTKTCEFVSFYLSFLFSFSVSSYICGKFDIEQLGENKFPVTNNRKFVRRGERRAARDIRLLVVPFSSRAEFSLRGRE